METTPAITITKDSIVMRQCPHCQTETAQVGTEGNTCLQCIADGGTCCSLAQYNRWVVPPTGEE